MGAKTDILVVEDDPTIGRLLQEIFTLTGGSVRLAASVEAATAAIDAARPTLITLDLNMPGVNGRSLLERVRQEGPAADLPVIVITSQIPVEPEVRSMAAAVVAKPFDLVELIAVVNQVAPDATPLQL